MTRFLALLLALSATTANAIVIRDDVDDAAYRIPASEFQALVDMPGEGHGVLVTPQWVITAAHVIPWHAELTQVVIDGKPRDVERVVIHPAYARPDQALIDQAVATGEWMLAVVAIASTDDIALVKLAEPVTEIAPVTMDMSHATPGEVVKIIGKGATGTGTAGHDPGGPNRTQLRRAYNTITSAHDRWFCYVFDAPTSALPLEGKTGSGDSGGPALVQVGEDWNLVGLAAWGFMHGDVRTTRPGLYGQFTCNVRLGHYAEWIKDVIDERS